VTSLRSDNRGLIEFSFNHYVGVKSSGGTVDLGSSCGYPNGGYNNIYSNSSYELWVGYYTTAWALSDWWGQPSVPWSDIYAQGTVLAWCPLSSPPGSYLSSKVQSDGKEQIKFISGTESSQNSDPLDLLLAINVRKADQYGTCVDMLE